LFSSRRIKTLGLIDLSILAEVFMTVSVILQGHFDSDEAREEFFQAFTSHGVEFLRVANSPLPQPSPKDRSLIEEIARAIACFRVRNQRKGEKS
jgi:hypothetical protein